MVCVALACAACASNVGPPPTIGQDCGTITRGETEAAGPAQCLLAAYTACRGATLRYITLDADVRETHTIYVKPSQGTCSVSDAVSATINLRTGPLQTYSCTGVVQESSILAFTSLGYQPQPGGIAVTGCGQEGYLLLYVPIPPHTPQQIGMNCGVVDRQLGTLSGDPTGPERCIWQAYQTCHAATLTYLAPNDLPYMLSVLPRDAVAVCPLYLQQTDRLSQGLDVYICAKLIQEPAGLALPTCTNPNTKVEVGLVIPAR